MCLFIPIRTVTLTIELNISHSETGRSCGAPDIEPKSAHSARSWLGPAGQTQHPTLSCRGEGQPRPAQQRRWGRPGNTRPRSGSCYRAGVQAGHGPTLVTGANGQLGQRLLRRLAELPDPRRTRALVRSQRAADSLANLARDTGAEIRIVDYTDEVALAHAADGASDAVHLVGILKETRSNRYIDAHERPSNALAKAADTNGLRRNVVISILGSRADAANPCLASKGRGEEILLAAKTPATVIRVPMVLGPGDPASEALRRQAMVGTVSLVRGGATLEQPIAADDVVAAILGALARTDTASRSLDLAGLESLTHRALVERAARVLGTTVRVRSLPLFAANTFAAIAERLLSNPPITRAMLGVLEHDDAIDAEPAARELGVSLIDLDETLRRAFARPSA